MLPPPLPAVVGYEVAGTVTEVAPGLETGPAVGDRVMAGTRFGGYVEEVVVGAADADGDLEPQRLTLADFRRRLVDAPPPPPSSRRACRSTCG